MEYPKAYVTLQENVAIVVFVKKNGDIRTMVCTRDFDTIMLCADPNKCSGELKGHDKRCNIGNGNVAAVDLVIGEPRSFNVGRVVNFINMGKVKTEQRLDEVMEEFKSLKESYEKEMGDHISMETPLYGE